MSVRAAAISLAFLIASSAGLASSCSDRHADEECYFVDDASTYSTIPLYAEWCEYEIGEVTPLFEHCPAGECIDYFITCDKVPLDHECQTCPADELDQKVLVALGAEYEQRCPDGPRELIDFERGCTFETEPIPPANDMKQCCYTAIVVGECSLMN